ncbi:hypothetical protein C5167_000064 [Papaver somniferum]|uniref:Glycine-rich protein n=1 Tax=Papaver somniferum TaxID=3469 RepID=A0A4Y7KSJ7_PAPSO|nr:late embryogenesis abundant protein M17-like [Papaver somniferum]RZC75826.1 hypothetical protein C5167_000064 [Papaver somniferum]
MGTMNNVRFFILLGLLIAVDALISSEVSAAKDLAERTRETAENNELQDAKYGGNQGGYPGNGGYQGGGGYPGNGGGGGRGGGGRRGGAYRCRHGCCDRGGYYRGDCRNCCYSAAQANDFFAETTTTTHNLKP